MGLVQLFKNRSDLNKSMVWKLIKLEQDRILANVRRMDGTFGDNWLILSSIQSLTGGSYLLLFKPFSSTAYFVSKRFRPGRTVSRLA